MDKIFEIKEYMDGGPNDKGVTIGFIKAETKEKAKIKAKITNGFKDAVLIDEELYNRRKLEAKQKYDMFCY